MKVFVITSVPLTPPWDQGDKNFAYLLTGALPHINFGVITSLEGPDPLGANLSLKPLYKDRHPSLLQKARVFSWLLSRTRNGTNGSNGIDNDQKTTDLYHLIYRPNQLSSQIFKVLPEFHRKPTLHTMPATAGNQYKGSSLFFADRVVALSEYGKRFLECSGVKNVIHIPPGIDVEVWAALQDQSDHLKDYLGLTGHPVLLYPGHFGPGYGAEEILKALPRIIHEVPELRLIFACRPRSKSDLKREIAYRQAIEQMGLIQAVRFYNTVDDMYTLVGASDALVLPLQTMQDKVDIPTSVLEAMAAGKPVVITNIPPMCEVFKGENHSYISEKGGMMVPPGDATALAQALITLFREKEMRDHMGKHGQALVRRCFDIHKIAQRYEILYHELTD
jgi:glycosyltransferase involved in cell wall biosynthesis